MSTNELYDKYGRVKTGKSLSEPAPRKYGKWMAIAAGVLILIPSLLVLLLGIMFLVLGGADLAGFGFFIFVFSWWYLFFGLVGLIGAVSAIMRTRGLLAVAGAVLMMLVMPYFAAPALLLIYLSRDEFW